MDAELISAMTMSRVQVAVAAKMMDVARDQGDAAVSLVRSAGKVIAESQEQMAAAADGLGRLVDVRA